MTWDAGFGAAPLYQGAVKKPPIKNRTPVRSGPITDSTHTNAATPSATSTAIMDSLDPMVASRSVRRAPTVRMTAPCTRWVIPRRGRESSPKATGNFLCRRPALPTPTGCSLGPDLTTCRGMPPLSGCGERLQNEIPGGDPTGPAELPALGVENQRGRRPEYAQSTYDVEVVLGVHIDVDDARGSGRHVGEHPPGGAARRAERGRELQQGGPLAERALPGRPGDDAVDDRTVRLRGGRVGRHVGARGPGGCRGTGRRSRPDRGRDPPRPLPRRWRPRRRRSRPGHPPANGGRNSTEEPGATRTSPGSSEETGRSPTSTEQT